MATEIGPSVTALALGFLIVAVSNPALGWCSSKEQGRRRGGFYFGGTQFDVGTNNFLPDTTARYNFPYNGIDFLNGPTGRASNGKNMADFLANKMGYDLSPPPYLSLFADPNCAESALDTIIRTGGSNFASLGSGVFIEAGIVAYGQVVSFDAQIDQFVGLARTLDALLGRNCSAAYLRESIYYIVAGSFDVLERLDTPFVNDPVFLVNLTNGYIRQIQALYEIGARKFAMITPPPIGCNPFARPTNPNGGCGDRANSLSADYGSSMARAMRRFKLRNGDIVYSVANAYNIIFDIITTPALYGIENVADACCGNGTTPCTPSSTLCDDRNAYVYWNRYQPTEKVAGIVIEAAFGNNRRYNGPVSFLDVLNAPIPSPGACPSRATGSSPKHIKY